MSLEPAAILDKPFPSDELGETTLREWLKALLMLVWTEGEGFSGKRPWGNGGWESGLATAMVKGGAIEGTLDEWEEAELEDGADFNALIEECIQAL